MSEPDERDDCIEMDPDAALPNDGRLDDDEHPPAPFVPEPLDAGDGEGGEEA